MLLVWNLGASLHSSAATEDSTRGFSIQASAVATRAGDDTMTYTCMSSPASPSPRTACRHSRERITLNTAPPSLHDVWMFEHRSVCSILRDVGRHLCTEQSSSASPSLCRVVSLPACFASLSDAFRTGATYDVAPSLACISEVMSVSLHELENASVIVLRKCVGATERQGDGARRCNWQGGLAASLLLRHISSRTRSI